MAKMKIAIIGAGPGGYVSAIRVAQLGAEVFLIEKDRVGGTCLNVGCIPTKALLTSIEVLSHFKKAGDFGIEVNNIKPNLVSMIEKKDRIVKRLAQGVEWLLEKNKVALFRGEAKVESPNRVHITLKNGREQIIDCNKLILAMGSEPTAPKSFNFNRKNVITSTEALSLDRIPSHLLILGGGYIGLEFACIFRELGSEVTVVEMLERILAGEDRDISEKLKLLLERKGIRIILGEKLENIEVSDSGVRCFISNKEEIYVEKMLLAIGRKPCISGIEKLGLKMENGFLKVNDRMETSIKDVYAIGDVARPPFLAHKASKEGIIAAENSCGYESTMDYRVIPSCIYTIPEVATVGLSEEKAKNEGYDVKTATFPFSAIGRAHTLSSTEGFVKIVADKESEEILGVHILGSSASELIAEASIVMKMEGTVKDIEDTIHAHPTLSEALMESSHLYYGRPIHI